MPFMSVYTSVAVFLFSAIALVIPSGMSPGAALLAVGSMTLLWAHEKPSLQPDERNVVLVFLLYFALCAATNLLHHERLREYDSPFRFVLAIPALLLLLRYRPAPAALWGGLSVGAIGGGFLALWERLELSELRASGYTNPIQYGNISMLLGTLCLAGLGWAAAQKKARCWVGLLVVGGVVGIMGSFLTASRGSWVSLPVCLIILYRYYGRVLRKRHLLGATAVVVVALAVVFILPQAGMQARVHDAVTETDGYFEKGNANTSVGARFEMWRTAVMIYPDHPWIGWGKNGFMQRKKELIAEGKVAAFTGDHTHSHNEYLDAAVKRGVVGVINVAIFYSVLGIAFMRGMARASAENRPYALAGVLMMVSYIGFGFTQSFLTHNNGVMTLGFMAVILLALMRSPNAPQSTLTDAATMQSASRDTVAAQPDLRQRNTL